MVTVVMITTTGVKMTKMVVCFFTAFLAVVYITVVFDILEIRVLMENYHYLCILGSRLYVNAWKYYCYLMQIRDGVFNVFFRGGCLFRQWVVDMYIKIESMRLDWYSNPNNQKIIRADLYQVSVNCKVHVVYYYIDKY
jgi:hypothetical protein